MREQAHIYVNLGGQSRPKQPHYTDERYLQGEHLEDGFVVKDRPDEPVHETICVNPLSYAEGGDHEPHYMKAHESDETDNPSRVQRIVCEEPHYMDPDRGRKAKADAIAEAVRQAVMRGEIDPDVLA